jgi:3-oxoacyl-[acyl-carrier protein] reductase
MSLRGLNGRQALVTGGGRGIGAAIAERLSGEGVAVAVNDIDGENAEATANRLGTDGATVVAVPGDVARREVACEVVERTVERLGGLEILINNAGVEHRSTIADHTVEAWEHVLAVNLSAPFWMAQAASPHLAARRHGAVVNVCSIAVIGFFGQAAYDASKGGLLTLTRSLAVELGRDGIRANAVCPGFVETDMARRQGLRRLGDLTVATLPVRRWGCVADVADAVAWLASDEAAYVSGQALFVDGGMVRC